MEHVNFDKSLTLEQYRIEILSGLKEIGEEIASFYYDGIKILNSDLASKSYLLAHIAREIEGGIRDIFAANKKEEIKKCSEYGNKIKQSSHIDEICEVLGVDRENEFAKEWHKIAKKFHSFAHRHGSWKTPRDKKAFDELWKQFEQILLDLVGKYLDLLTLIDQVLKKDEPTKEILETLDNLLQNEVRRGYFFKKLKSPKWFEPLIQKGYFSPEKAPGPKLTEQGVFIPQWCVLPYLEKISQQVNISGNEKYIDKLLKIIKEVSNYKDANGQHVDNYCTWWYFVKILINIPNEKIGNDILNLIPVWLDSKFDNTLPASEILEKLLPKFLDSDKLEDSQKAEKIIDIVTKIKWIPRHTEQPKKEIIEEYKHIFDKPEEQRTDEEKLKIALLGLDKQEPVTIVNAYWLIESFINKKIASKIGEKCSENVIFNLADKLKNIFKARYPAGKVDSSNIWFSSLFTTPHIYRTKQIITLILRDILLAKATKDVDTTKKVIKKFLGEDYKYPIFKRLILFVIGTEWQTYQDIFWNMIDEDENGDLLNDPYYEAEVYTILQRYGNTFSLEEKEKIKSIIEKVPRKPHPEEKYKELYSAYQKQKWYSALKYDDFFNPLYERYKDITKKEEKLSFEGPKVHVGPDPSPLSKEIVLKMSNEELAEYLRTFKTVDWREGPTTNGLADILRDAVEEKPEKFIDNLNPFLKTGYLYVYNILCGIRDVLEKKKIVDWEKLLNFIKDYITPEEFWNGKYKIEGDYWKTNHLCIVGKIGEIIRQGTKDDSCAFSELYFQDVQEILFLLLDRTLLEKEKISSEKSVGMDYITYASNSSFGKITKALFMLALRIKRFEEKSKTKQKISWEVSIKDKYETLLNHGIIEGYVWLGAYLPDFYYLDKVWTENKINTITSVKEQLWEAFMEGYLLWNKFYNELYKLMRPHYEIAINCQLKEKDLIRQFAQHICVGYLQGIDDINDENGLFRKVLDKWDASQIKEIVNFFWMQRRDYEREPDKSVVLDQEQPIEDEERAKIRSKIIDFWRWVYENKYKEKQEIELNSDDREILSEFCKLTVFLLEINSENFEWLKISALNTKDYSDSFLFIEYLDKVKDKGQSVKFVGKVFLEMLKNTTPTFGQKCIQSIVKYLYDSKTTEQVEEAKNICDIYASRGYEFLRELYDKYENRKTN